MSLNELFSDKTLVLSHDVAIFSRLSTLKSSAGPVLVAISGESAAGKTTFLNTLGSIFKESAFIDADHYFRDISEEIKEKGGFSNLVNAGYESDSPSNFLLPQLQQDLIKLKKGQGVKIPFYEMKTGTSIKEVQEINPAPLIFVAGICTFYEQVRDLFDFRIYLQPDKLEQRIRYFQRAAQRGQSQNMPELWGQFHRVCEMAEKYIIPTKQYADIVVKGRLPKPIIKRCLIDFVKGLNKE